MALGSDTCSHILQTGLLNCGLEHTGTELWNVRTPWEERWVDEVWGGGGGEGDRRQASGLVASSLRVWWMHSVAGTRHLSGRCSATLAQESRVFVLDRQNSATQQGKAMILQKKKEFIILKCFTLGMTMCLHNTYRRVKLLYIEK